MNKAVLENITLGITSQGYFFAAASDTRRRSGVLVLQIKQGTGQLVSAGCKPQKAAG